MVTMQCLHQPPHRARTIVVEAVVLGIVLPEVDKEGTAEHQRDKEEENQENPKVVGDPLEHQDERREALIDVLQEAEETQPEEHRRRRRVVGAQVHSRLCCAHKSCPGATERRGVDPVPIIAPPGARQAEESDRVVEDGSAPVPAEPA